MRRLDVGGGGEDAAHLLLAALERAAAERLDRRGAALQQPLPRAPPAHGVVAGRRRDERRHRRAAERARRRARRRARLVRAERPRREQLEPAAVLGGALDVRHPHHELVVEAPHRVRRRARRRRRRQRAARLGGRLVDHERLVAGVDRRHHQRRRRARRRVDERGPAARRDAAAALDERGRPLAALAQVRLVGVAVRQPLLVLHFLFMEGEFSVADDERELGAPERQPRRVVAAVDLHRQAAVEAARRVHDRTVELRRHRGGGAEGAGAVAGAEEEVREAVVVLPEEVEGGGDERAAARAADAAAAAAAAAERRRQQQRGGVEIGAPQQPAEQPRRLSQGLVEPVLFGEEGGDGVAVGRPLQPRRRLQPRVRLGGDGGGGGGDGGGRGGRRQRRGALCEAPLERTGRSRV